MITDSWYVQNIDHRISTALIFFLLLFLLGNGKRRSLYPLRMGLSLLVLCAVSLFIRTVTDVYLVGEVFQGLGHSVHLLAMSLLYMAACAFCYETTSVEVIYLDLLALTIFKIAWNTFKVFAAAATMNPAKQIWCNYSVMGSIVS